MKKVLFGLAFLFQLYLPSHAYIDPGTGSMLFSIVLCSASAAYFLFYSLFIKLKQSFFADKKLASSARRFVIYSEGNQYYKIFKPVIDEFERRKIPVMYYTSAENDLIFSEKYDYITAEYIGKGNKAYFKLAFLNADVCLMTTPQLDVLQLKRSKNTKHYCHILHSIGFSMMYRLFSLDYYDSVLLDAEYQYEMIREIERKRGLKLKQLPVIGSTYMDYNLQHLPQMQRSLQFTILLAPSWGGNCLLNKFGRQLLNKLKSADYKVIIRPHPQSMISDKQLIETLRKEFPNSKNIEWDFSNDNMHSMAASDILISDYSSIMLDWAFLFKKPFLYIKKDINYEILDCSEFDNYTKYRFAEKIGRELDADNGSIDNITEIIREINQDENFKKNIETVRDYVWAYQGKAAERAVDFLVKVQQEVSAE